VAPSWCGAPIIDNHDYILLRERHCVAFAQDIIEFHTPGERPQDHENFHHVTAIELVLDGVCMVRAGLLEESLEVVRRRPHLALGATCISRNVPHTGVACFLHRRQPWS
jgi:hypothetical protein